MSARSFLRFLTVVTALVSCAFAFCEEKNETQKKISPQALEIIKKFSETMKAQKKGSVDITMQMTVNAEGMKQEFKTESHMVFERPNKVAYITKGGMMSSSLICDGEKLYTYVPMLKKYTEEKAPAKLEDVKFNSGAQGIPVAEMIVSDNPEKVIMEGVNSASIVGTEKIDEVECTHIRCEQDDVDWDMWLQIGDKPLIKKFIPDMNKMMKKMLEAQGLGSGEESELIKNMKYQVEISFKNWKLNEELPADTFKFIPPEGATKVDSLLNLGGKGKEKENLEEDSGSELSVGNNAPDFELDTIADSKFKLSDYKGKIIVLDFWATWCPPCRKALPIVAQTTAKFKDKGVVFCAVNQGENKEKIKAFLGKEKIECNVALDSDSSVGDKYGASSIPRTVIIGKDGKIKNIHVGFSEDLEKKLSEELEKLLSEK